MSAPGNNFVLDFGVWKRVFELMENRGNKVSFCTGQVRLHH